MLTEATRPLLVSGDTVSISVGMVTIKHYSKNWLTDSCIDHGGRDIHIHVYNFILYSTQCSV